MASVTDSLFGYCQVRHVDAAVGQPASSHKCEKDPQVGEYESGSSEVERAVICSTRTSTVSTHTTAEAAAAQDTVTAWPQLNQVGVHFYLLLTVVHTRTAVHTLKRDWYIHTTAEISYRYKLSQLVSKHGVVIHESKKRIQTVTARSTQGQMK